MRADPIPVMPEREVRAVLDALATAIDTCIRGGLPAFIDRTLTDTAALRDELAQVRQQGYVLSRGECQHYVVGATATGRDHAATVTAAIAAAPSSA